MLRTISRVVLIALLLSQITGAAAGEATDEPPPWERPVIQATPAGPSIRPAPSGGPRCEWIPVEERRATPACGFYSSLVAKAALYMCEQVSNGKTCEHRCRFVECVKGP